MNASRDTPGLLGHLSRAFEEREEVLQRALACERRREAKGVYARWERLALRRAQTMNRESLERHAAAMARFVRSSLCAQHVRDLIRDFDNAADKLRDEVDEMQKHLDARREKKIEELQAQPAVHGAEGRNVRWAPRDKTVEYVVRRWCERKWPSKAQFARKVVAETIKEGKSNGFVLKETNAERTIIRWITDYLSATHPP